MIYYFFFFFFSSRRRHTRYIGDWSSDVCSSDLYESGSDGRSQPPPRAYPCLSGRRTLGGWGLWTYRPKLDAELPAGGEIGRASCRERGERWVGGEAVEERRSK